MRRTRKCTGEPLPRHKVVEDFLPPPDQLVLKEDGVKVTLSLNRKSVDFFNAHAAASEVPYQRMIRTLLDSYAERYSRQAS
jgi:predicted DNA binding CopG/RHH family protein